MVYLLTPWCRVLLEKLTGLQLVKKFPVFHGTRRFITALKSVRHLSLSWVSPIQSIYPHLTSLRSILILSTHLRLGLPVVSFPPVSPARPYTRVGWYSTLKWSNDCFLQNPTPSLTTIVFVIRGGIICAIANALLIKHWEPKTKWTWQLFTERFFLDLCVVPVPLVFLIGPISLIVYQIVLNRDPQRS